MSKTRGRNYPRFTIQQGDRFLSTGGITRSAGHVNRDASSGGSARDIYPQVGVLLLIIALINILLFQKMLLINYYLKLFYCSAKLN